MIALGFTVGLPLQHSIQSLGRVLTLYLNKCSKWGLMETTTHKYGDLREDGFIFDHYDKTGREHWRSPIAHKLQKEKGRIRALEYYHKKYKHIKKHPVIFARVRKYGDVREDGYRFCHYDVMGREHWRSPQSWQRQRRPRIKVTHKISAFDYPEIDLTMPSNYKG